MKEKTMFEKFILAFFIYQQRRAWFFSIARL